ncbi:MAG: helix-turn-helix domain-containing protein [Ruminococcaceae bacterium]|nr:helix-turn-helix domain-containing protein [Oscillospiraceae bacterium]
MNNKYYVPISEKVLLTVEEAACYSNIGINKISELLNNPLCEFVLHVGKKRLVKRKEFEKYIEKTLEI